MKVSPNFTVSFSARSPHFVPLSAPEVPQKGTLEVTIASKSTRLGPGSVARVHSNGQRGWKNVGNTPAQYFVLAIGND
jgi:hypothetical protein